MDRLWVVANISVAVTAIPNLVAMLALGGVFKTLMQDELSGERAYSTARVEETGPVLRRWGAVR